MNDWIDLIWSEIKKYITIAVWLVGVLLFLIIFSFMLFETTKTTSNEPKILYADSVSVYKDTTYKICFVKAKLGKEFYATQISCEKFVSSSSSISRAISSSSNNTMTISSKNKK